MIVPADAMRHFDPGTPLGLSVARCNRDQSGALNERVLEACSTVLFENLDAVAAFAELGETVERGGMIVDLHGEFEGIEFE